MTTVQVDQTLGVIVMDAVRLADELRAAGAPADQILGGIARVLREHWPKGRAEAWHLLCDRCVDTGWELRDCPLTPCAREKVHAPHRYAVPCWCAKGRTMEARPKSQTDELASVGKMKPATRWGR